MEKSDHWPGNGCMPYPLKLASDLTEGLVRIDREAWHKRLLA